MTASKPKSTPRSGMPAGTAGGRRSAFATTIVPMRAESKSPSRKRGFSGLGAMPSSVENQISMSYSSSIAGNLSGFSLQKSLPLSAAYSRKAMIFSLSPMKCTASRPRSAFGMSNLASRAMLGITAPLVANRSPAVKRPRGSSSSVENATIGFFASITSAASSPRSISVLNAASSSRLRANTTQPGPSRSPPEIMGLPSGGSGPRVMNSSSVEKKTLLQVSVGTFSSPTFSSPDITGETIKADNNIIATIAIAICFLIFFISPPKFFYFLPKLFFLGTAAIKIYTALFWLFKIL